MSSTLLVNLRDPDDRPITFAHVRVSFNDEDSDAAYDDHISDSAGNVAFMFQPDGPKTVHVQPVGYAVGRVSFTLPHGDVLVTVGKTGAPIPSIGPLSRLHVDGPLGFRTEQDRRVFLAGASAFLLYRDFLDGRDLEPFLLTLQGLGCNAVRVFGMCHYIPVNQGQRAFTPQDYGDRYYDAIPAFYDVLGRFGLYGMWTNFPDNGFIMPDLGEQLRHHARVTAALGSLPTVYELTNEPGAHDFNAIDAGQFPEPTAFPACVGGYGDEYGAELPPGPWWAFGSYHPPRRYPGHILDCNAVNHPFVLKLNRGLVLMEPDRYGSRGNANVDQARQSAGAARQATCGAVFHSACGRDGLPFDDETMRSAEAWFGALR